MRLSGLDLLKRRLAVRTPVLDVRSQPARIQGLERGALLFFTDGFPSTQTRNDQNDV